MSVLLLKSSKVSREHALQSPELTIGQLPTFIPLKHLAHKLFLIGTELTLIVNDCVMCHEVLLRLFMVKLRLSEVELIFACRCANHVAMLQLRQELFVLVEKDLLDEMVVFGQLQKADHVQIPGEHIYA